jgi:hypothetical protein
LTPEDIKKNDGEDLLISNGTLLSALKLAYPDYPWQPFDEVGLEFWDDVNNQRIFLDWLGSKLKVKVSSKFIFIILMPSYKYITGTGTLV